MNRANPTSAKTEIIKQLGYFPAFLIPALDSSLIYRSLVQQTLFAYVNNPLPAKFKEKLFVVLSRYAGIDYFTICHSCTLSSLGVSVAEIIELGKIGYPHSESEVVIDLETLTARWNRSPSCYQDSQLEISLLRCAILIFLAPEQAIKLCTKLKELLGIINYHYLIVFLGYIKLCHQWLVSNRDISHQQDRRSQLYLGSLLLENPDLANFLISSSQSNNPIQPSLVPLKSNSVDRSSFKNNRRSLCHSLVQLKRETLTTCLANAPFPVMINTQAGEIVYLNRNWLEATSYDASEISTIKKWNQKAQVKQREIVKLPAETYQQLYQKYVAPAHQTAIETTLALKQIIDSLIDVVPSIDRAKVKAKNQIADAIRSEVTVATKNGEQLFWELYSAPLNFDLGQDELTVSIAKDITDVVNYETKLAAVKSDLQFVLEATKTGNWSWDLKTNQVKLCRRGRSILGLGDFSGSYAEFLSSIHPDEREFVDLAAAKAIQTRQDLDLKYLVVKADRKLAQIRIKARLNCDRANQPVNLVGIVTDVTPQGANFLEKHFDNNHCRNNLATQISNCSDIQQHKVPSLDQLATIINLLPYYLLVIDVKTQTISLMNAELAKSLSLSESEAIGKTIAQCFDPEYTKQIDWQNQQTISSKQALRITEKVMLQNETHYLDTVVMPLFDAQGEIYALLRTSSDLPDLAETQEALSQRTLQLEAANRELESFSYSVSHDLQAPLRVINGFSQVLWSNYQPNLDNRGKHYLQRIQANSNRMSDLIDALLQLSRVTRIQMKLVSVNLSAIALEIIDELRTADPQRQVKLDVAPDLLTKGDPKLLRIVFSNLLHNAWKYTSNRELAQITIGVEHKATQPIFFVKDNGAGFNAEYADKLFVAFQRLHSQAEFPGTGIGLATVQRIIYRHGGKVWAEGESDRGATIYFTL